MIASSFFIVALVHLVIETRCDGDSSSVYTSFDIDNSTANISNDDTTETHSTTCKITTERLVATAQATFTRVLTGACNSKHLDERFEKFESSMNKRLGEMEEMIVRAMLRTRNSTEQIELKSRGNRVSDENDDSPDVIMENNFKKIDNPLTREDEVKLFNNSIRGASTSDDQNKAYRYYWRVLNVREKLLQWKTGRSERSPTFHVGNAGYAMYLKFTPKYFPDGTIFISVGLTEGTHDSKLVWPFPLRIRIKILDLKIRNKHEDRSSRLWDPPTICSSYFWGRPGMLGTSDNPECVGLSLPRRLLTDEHPRSSMGFYESATLDGLYVSNDCILVELTVYL